MRWLGVVLVLAVGAVGALTGVRVGAQGPAKPNIVFILTDDEDTKIHAFMPKTTSLLEERGTTFVNFFVTYSLCCPSRATILRGQYPHNTGIEANTPPLGGFARFVALGREQSTIATWLQGAGYRTVFAGKYLNGYGAEGPPPTHVPPGWTEWYAGVAGRPYQEFNYQLNENGTLVQYGNRPQDYLTDVIARKAVEAIRRAAGQPVFLHLAPFAPHQPATPAPRHAEWFPDAQLPRPPSFNEPDVSDKPAFLQGRPPLGPRQIAEMEILYRKRLQSLQAIDDLVEAVVRALADAGQLDNTYIVYTSDNGFHMGEHRMPQGKATAYEEDIRVPLIVRGPGVPAGRRIEQLVVNNDLAPTFAEIAGFTAPAFVDGRSFLPLLRGQPAAWRQSFMVDLRAVGDAQAEQGDAPAPRRRSGFDAIRTAEWTYVEWMSGDRELYDLRADPYQLQNRIATADPALVRLLAARLADLARCSAAGCRRVEDQPVR